MIHLITNPQLLKGTKKIFKKSGLAPKIISTESTKEFGDIERVMVELIIQAYKPEKNRTEKVEGYTYLPNFSTEFQAVYKKGNDIIVAIKGTSSKIEIFQDLELISRRVKNVKKKATKDFSPVERAFGDKNIMVTGHSLGGFKAMLLSKRFRIQGSVFAPFIANLNNQNTLNIINNTPLIKKFSINGDVLSNQVLKGKNAFELFIKGKIGAGLLFRHKIKTYRKIPRS